MNGNVSERKNGKVVESEEEVVFKQIHPVPLVV
jgi:hypothetical protein